jgi:Glycosyl transferase family 2
MKIAMTLLVRNEEDVIRSHLDFHLHAGVDVVIATDNGSVDGTAEILEEYQQRGVLQLLHEPAGEYRQREWVTRMARLAATEHGADWVINSDADEFWWPRGSSLKHVLEPVPERYGVVQSVIRHFVPVAGDGEPFFERMVYRLSPQAPINDPAGPWRPYGKVVHRARPDVVVREGAHGLINSNLRILRGWFPIETLHFPVRSSAQLAQKGAVWGSAVGRWYGEGAGPGAAYHARAHVASSRGVTTEYFAGLAVSPEQLTKGMQERVLSVDTRLRNMLRALSEAGAGASFPLPSVTDDALFALDVAVLGEADVIRARRRLDELEQRLRAVESALPLQLEAGARAVARRLRGAVRRAPR